MVVCGDEDAEEARPAHSMTRPAEVSMQWRARLRAKGMQARIKLECPHTSLSSSSTFTVMHTGTGCCFDLAVALEFDRMFDLQVSIRHMSTSVHIVRDERMLHYLSSSSAIWTRRRLIQVLLRVQLLLNLFSSGLLIDAIEDCATKHDNRSRSWPVTVKVRPPSALGTLLTSACYACCRGRVHDNLPRVVAKLCTHLESNAM